MNKIIQSMIIVILLMLTGFSTMANIVPKDEFQNDNLDVNYTLGFESISSEVVIGNISTTMGKVLIEVINIGDDEAINIDWNIIIRGGSFNSINKEKSGVIDLIEPDKTITIETDFIIGFGPIIIDITVGSLGKILDGSIFLFFIKINPEFNVILDVIADGFNSPIYATHCGDGSNRLFIVDQIGIIYIIEDGELLSEPFLDIRDKIVDLDSTYDERGLLGLAFHPDYVENGKFYVYYSSPLSSQASNHETILSEFSVSEEPNMADPTSEKIIFRIDQPEANHNGGQILFGKEDYLYLGLGDGGGAGDQHGSIGNGQDITTALGSIIRIDVNSGDPYSIPSDNPFVDSEGLDEIYSWGFRNPWRFSYDEESDMMIIADVGQDQWEEINRMDGPGNFGWRILEATHPYDIDLADELGIDIDSLVDPIHEYSHSLGRSITGGYIYRGIENPSLYGKYIFGDWSSSFVVPRGKIFYLEETNPGVWQRFDLINGQSFNRFILSFGEDEDGEIYVLSKTTLGPTGATGDVRKIIIE